MKIKKKKKEDKTEKNKIMRFFTDICRTNGAWHGYKNVI